MKINNIILIGAISVCGLTIVEASSSFRWNPGPNSLLNFDGNPIAVGGATVLTYISTDTVVDAQSEVSGGKLELKSSYGDDAFYLAQSNVGLVGRYITPFFSDPTDTAVGKYIYAIVLDLPFASFTSLNAVPGGTRMAISSMGMITGSVKPVEQTSVPLPPPPQSFNGGDLRTSLQVIPEPAGATLIVMGLGILLARRIKARNS